jgi:hypothetical protein
MDVIHVPLPIFFISYAMLPEAALPYIFFSWTIAICTNTFGYVFLNFAPSSRKINIILRHPPNAMQMIGQHDNGIDYKRAMRHNLMKCGSQQSDIFRDGENRSAVVSYYSEEVNSAGDEETPIIAHGLGFKLVDALRLSTLRNSQIYKGRVDKRAHPPHTFCSLHYRPRQCEQVL